MDPFTIYRYGESRQQEILAWAAEQDRRVARQGWAFLRFKWLPLWQVRQPRRGQEREGLTACPEAAPGN
jgi:hypothetical protein